MRHSEQEFSDLCFLPPQYQRGLEALVKHMNNAENDFERELRNGNASFKALGNRKITLPKRDPMEWSNKYDRDLENWSRMLLENTEEVLQQKWENCTIMADYIASSMSYQQDARELLSIGYRTKPRVGSKTWNVAVDRSLETHDLLKELQATLRGFEQAPLDERYASISQRLDKTIEPMRRMKMEHARFLKHLPEHEAQEICDKTLEYTKQAGTYLKEMDTLSELLTRCTKLVPDLQDVVSVYQPAIPQARGLR